MPQFVWHCGSRDCPTHSRWEHRCQVGVWFCRRRQPPCPGHSSPDHHCEKGTVWHCGSRDCPTHSRWEHRCQVGVWFCRRRQPPCPGHSSPDHHCPDVKDTGPFSARNTDLGKFSHGNFDVDYDPNQATLMVTLKVTYRFRKGHYPGEPAQLEKPPESGRRHLEQRRGLLAQSEPGLESHHIHSLSFD